MLEQGLICSKQYTKLCISGSNKVVLPVSCFTLFTGLICKNFTIFQHNTAQYQSTSWLTQSSSTFKQKHVYLPSKNYLLCLQLLLNGILQCLMLCVMVFLQTGFSEDQTGKNPTVQGQDFRMGVATLLTQIL